MMTVEEICACAADGSLDQRTWMAAVLQLLCRIASTEVQTETFTMNLAQNAGTYDLFTASGGPVLIKNISFHVDVAAVGLTSITAQSDDTTPVQFLASTAAASLTAGKNLTPYVGPSILATGKKGQYTIVGNGSAGSITVMVEYVSAGGVLN